MTNYNDGQIHGWNGGDCPVYPETVVRYWLRNMAIATETYRASGLRWTHRDESGDIIAFQVVEAYAEPKVIWLVRNVADNHIWLIAKDEADAWRFAGEDPEKRRVEKYQEVPL